MRQIKNNINNCSTTVLARSNTYYSFINKNIYSTTVIGYFKSMIHNSLQFQIDETIRESGNFQFIVGV